MTENTRIIYATAVEEVPIATPVDVLSDSPTIHQLLNSEEFHEICRQLTESQVQSLRERYVNDSQTRSSPIADINLDNDRIFNNQIILHRIASEIQHEDAQERINTANASLATYCELARELIGASVGLTKVGLFPWARQLAGYAHEYRTRQELHQIILTSIGKLSFEELDWRSLAFIAEKTERETYILMNECFYPAVSAKDKWICDLIDASESTDDERESSESPAENPMEAKIERETRIANLTREIQHMQSELDHLQPPTVAHMTSVLPDPLLLASAALETVTTGAPYFTGVAIAGQVMSALKTNVEVNKSNHKALNAHMEHKEAIKNELEVKRVELACQSSE